MKNIEIRVRGMRMTMKEENKLRLSQILSAHPFASIVAKKDGKTFSLKVTREGLRWVLAQ